MVKQETEFRSPKSQATLYSYNKDNNISLPHASKTKVDLNPKQLKLITSAKQAGLLIA